ncbi:MAG TPA: HlyD family efflux transporter periplasmic adaptor subunit [Pyrinomonadaceae bacterium]|nr:HlyD family efflux transporter periplasmic adaptor subunit [Pyrinomonadaceae bacterium]
MSETLTHGDTAATEPNEASATTPPSGRRRKKSKGGLIVVMLVVAAIALGVWYVFIRRPALQGADNLVVTPGRIAGDEATVSAKTSGRVREIRFREGDSVRAGDVIALLDDDQVRAREDAAKSAVQQSEARVRSSQQQISILQAQVAGSSISVDQSKIDSQGRVSQARANVAAAEAALAQARAAHNQAKYDYENQSQLAKAGDLSERQGMLAKSNLDATTAAVNAAEEQVKAARGAYAAQQAALKTPAILNSQTLSIQEQINKAQSEIAAAMADAEKARAQLREAEANRSDLQIVAPFDGTITVRSVEPGEVINPGTAIVTLVNLQELYLRVFVPIAEIDKVQVGQAARIYLDSQPDRAIEATVSRIDPDAAFTPENTYYREDRVRQVVGVKLAIKNSDGSAKPGVPGEGEILVSGSGWPEHTQRQAP